MSIAYVFDNELLGDNGDKFADALIAKFEGSEEECLNWFNENYDANDYSMSFTAPTFQTEPVNLAI